MNESEKRFYHSITNNAVKRHNEFSSSKKENIWEGSFKIIITFFLLNIQIEPSEKQR